MTNAAVLTNQRLRERPARAPDRSGPAVRETVEQLAGASRLWKRSPTRRLRSGARPPPGHPGDAARSPPSSLPAAPEWAPRDVTPEATRAVIDREIPGLGKLVRPRGASHHPWPCFPVGGRHAAAGPDCQPAGSPRRGVESLMPFGNWCPTARASQGRTEHTPRGRILVSRRYLWTFSVDGL